MKKAHECCIVTDGEDTSFLYALAKQLGYKPTIESGTDELLSILSIYKDIKCVFLYGEPDYALILTRLTERRIVAVGSIIYDSEYVSYLLRQSPTENIGLLIHTLRLSGYTANQISQLFNSIGLKPIRADKWTHENIRYTYWKWKEGVNNAEGGEE